MSLNIENPEKVREALHLIAHGLTVIANSIEVNDSLVNDSLDEDVIDDEPKAKTAKPKAKTKPKTAKKQAEDIKDKQNIAQDLRNLCSVISKSGTLTRAEVYSILDNKKIGDMTEEELEQSYNKLKEYE